MKKPNVQEALVHLMVIISASDREMADPELSGIGALARTLPVFEGFEPHRLLAVAQKTQQWLQRENGLSEILDAVRDTVPVELHPTAYLIAVEVAVVDLHVDPAEVRLLHILRDRLDLDRATVEAIEQVVRLRYRTARIHH